nr:hypothetical protein [Parabacteroides merdae]
PVLPTYNFVTVYRAALGNKAQKCKSKTDYTEWQRHGFENPHFFDIMYLPTCDMYARLHVDAIDFGKNENLELLSRERDFYLCLFDFFYFIKLIIKQT